MIVQNKTIDGARLKKGFWKSAGNPLGNIMADLFPALNLSRSMPEECFVWSLRSKNVHIIAIGQTEPEVAKKYVIFLEQAIERKDVKESEKKILRSELKTYKTGVYA